MQVVYERCAAIDVHQETAVTTILITQANGHVQKETRTFTTMTSDLLRLDDWLQERGVTVVAMESTGVFWHPIFNILEEGREMLEAMMGGEQDAEVLAALARGRLRAKLADLRLALEGRMQPHHRFLLQRILAHIDFLDQSIAQVEQEIEQRLRPFEEAVKLVQTITGLQATTTAGILAEIGIDMTRFPSDKHLASWAGVCPGNKQSAGKRLSGKTAQGNTHLRALLGEAAWAAARTKGSYLSAFYQRLARRRGRKKPSWPWNTSC